VRDLEGEVVVGDDVVESLVGDLDGCFVVGLDVGLAVGL